MIVRGIPVRALAARLLPWLERVVVALLCWQAAGLAGWAFAPDTAGPMLTPPRPAPASVESRDVFLGWFGGEVPIGAPASDYTLMAVIAGRRDGVALLKDSDGKGVVARTGDAVDAQSRLLAVGSAAATLERGGARLRIRLPQNEPGATITRARSGAPARSAPAKAAPANAAAAAPPAEAIRITRGQMAGMMGKSSVTNWDKGLSDAPDGGIRIDQVAEQPFAQLLQLKDGDILKRVDRRALTRVADVSLFFSHFGQRTSVRLELVRNGASLTQRYDIQP
jgi:hypothetical protein